MVCATPGALHSGSKRPRDRAREKEEREAILQASNFLSASRQIENHLCTARESLLGSGAWNKEFYSELQSRPFYQSINVTMCASVKGASPVGCLLSRRALPGRNRIVAATLAFSVATFKIHLYYAVFPLLTTQCFNGWYWEYRCGSLRPWGWRVPGRLRQRRRRQGQRC
jgi:hypothetical protein